MNKKSTYIKAAVLVLLVFIGTIILFKLNILTFSQINSARHIVIKFFKGYLTKSENFIYTHKSTAPILYIVIFTVRTIFIIFPYSVMIVFGGKIFGPVLGFIYSMVAIYLSSSLAFGLGRFLDKKIIERILKKELKGLDSKVEKHGFKIIFLMRISMIFPFDLLSFTAGMSKMNYKDFILGTILGIIPETLSLTYLGKNLSNPFSFEFVFTLILVLVTVAIPIVYSKVFKKHKGSI